MENKQLIDWDKIKFSQGGFDNTKDDFSLMIRLNLFFLYLFQNKTIWSPGKGGS